MVNAENENLILPNSNCSMDQFMTFTSDSRHAMKASVSQTTTTTTTTSTATVLPVLQINNDNSLLKLMLAAPVKMSTTNEFDDILIGKLKHKHDSVTLSDVIPTLKRTKVKKQVTKIENVNTNCDQYERKTVENLTQTRPKAKFESTQQSKSLVKDSKSMLVVAKKSVPRVSTQFVTQQVIKPSKLIKSHTTFSYQQQPALFNQVATTTDQ